MGAIRLESSELVHAAVEATYATAGMVYADISTAIVSLRHLIAAYPLVVDEIPYLTQNNAQLYLHARLARPLCAPGRDGEQLSGFLYTNAAGGWILISAAEPLVRRRFSIAHELGHYVLHFLPVLRMFRDSSADDPMEFSEELVHQEDEGKEIPPSGGRVTFYRESRTSPATPSEHVQMELEADAFAASLLLPASVCHMLTQKYADLCGNDRTILARRLSSECLVSESAVLRRLAGLDLPEGVR